MNPVLALLALGHLLQKNLGTLAVCWQQRLIAAGGNAVPGIPQHTGPEFRRTVQIRTVDHDNQLAPDVRMRLPAHKQILYPGRPNSQTRPPMPPTGPSAIS